MTSNSQTGTEFGPYVSAEMNNDQETKTFKVEREKKNPNRPYSEA